MRTYDDATESVMLRFEPGLVDVYGGADGVLLTVRQGHQADGRIAATAPLDRDQTAALLAALHRAAEVAWPEANEAVVVPRPCEMGAPL